MTSIVDLPAEVLDHVLRGSDISHHAITLWKCGSRLLNAKLAAGCTKIDLQDHKRRYLTRFPQMLTQLRHLRSLRISRGTFRMEGAESIGKALQKLSSSIEELELEFSESEFSFLQTPFPIVIKSIAEILSPKKEVDDIVLPLDGESRLWDVRGTFPALKRLILNTRSPALHSSDLKHLPPSITHLQVGVSELDHVGVWPPHLQELIVNQLKPILPPRSFPSFPPTLKILSTGFDFSSEDEIRTLPRQLEELKSRNEAMDFKLSVEATAALPPNLKSLRLSPYTPFEEIMAKNPGWIPKNLTILDMQWSYLDPCFLPSLPSCMTKLKISSFNWPLITDSSMFPASLNKLSVRSCTQLNQGFMRILPPRLKSLRIYEAEYANVNALEALPKSLTSVFIDSDAFFDMPSYWPPNLTKCTISFLRTSDNPHKSTNLPETLLRFATSSRFPLLQLPSRLASLAVALKCNLKEGAENSVLALLPRTLRSLNMGTFVGVLTKTVLAALPTGLTSLNFDVPEQVLPLEQDGDQEEASERTISIDDPNLLRVASDCFEDLNSMTSLRVAGHLSYRHDWEKATFPESCLFKLPKNLTFLSINVTEITDDPIEFLPRSLLVLVIFSPSDYTTSDSHDHLPPHLTTLKLFKAAFVSQLALKVQKLVEEAKSVRC
jgi:hypothetical protein